MITVRERSGVRGKVSNAKCMCTQPSTGHYLLDGNRLQTSIYALLTPISHPGCMRNPFVCPRAASAWAGEAKTTENALSPGFDPLGVALGGSGDAEV